MITILNNLKNTGVDPKKLPVLNPLVWYEGDKLSGADTEKIAQWTDSSGNGYHAIQATEADQPVVAITGLNGKKTARFSGTNAMAVDFPAPDEMSIFFVASPGAASPSEEFVFGSSMSTTGVRWAFGFGSGGDGMGAVGASGAINLGAYVAEAYAFRSRAHTKSSTVWNVWGNGIHLCVDISDTSTPTGTFHGCIGGEAVSSYRLTGDIAEFILYDRVVTEQERIELEAYFKLKWGV
jgi:hypothetical protein